MAKDTEKLIRQLSLISYLMAERRPVTATEIRRDVEGYSDMTEDAFARRFYADRAELDSLGIHLRVDKPADGFSEQENYSLAPEAFHLPAIAFTDSELAALQTALTLLDGEFAYAEPLRLALQQITWGRPSPLGTPAPASIGLGITASAGGGELSRAAGQGRHRDLPPQADRVRVLHDAERRRPRCARSTPTSCCSRAASSTSSATRTSATRCACSASRASAARSPTRPRPSTTSSAPPTSTRASTRAASRGSSATASGRREVWVSEQIAWYVERQFGAYGEMGDERGRRAHVPHGVRDPAPARRRGSLGFGEHARVLGPPELVAEARERARSIVELPLRRAAGARRSPPATPAPAERDARADGPGTGRARAPRRDGGIRPERFARLVTLASVLIAAGREGERLRGRRRVRAAADVRAELREDVSVLNVVNFGGGAYVIYAEVHPDGEIEVDPEPYSDTFDRPARLLPIEAQRARRGDRPDRRAPAEGALRSAREKIVAALGDDPVEEGLQIATPTPRTGTSRASRSRRDRGAPAARDRVLGGQRGRSSRTRDDRAVRADQRPRGLVRRRVGPGRGGHCATSGWTGSSARSCSTRPSSRASDLDPVADIERLAAHRRGRGLADRARLDLPRAGALGARGAHGAGRARRRRGDRRVAFKGDDYLVREVLKEAGDAAVLEPAEAREAVLRGRRARCVAEPARR